MGLFDKIKQAAVSAGEGYAEAYECAMQQDLQTIHEAFKEIKMTEVVKLNGYKAAFRAKCEGLDTRTLKELRKEFRPKGLSISLKTNHSVEIIEDILVHRGVLSRDNDGNIIG